MAGEKLDPRKLGIHAFDKFIGFVGFAAVLAARGLDNGAGAICWRGGRKLAPSRDQQVLMLLAGVVSHSNRGFDPHNACPIIEAPSRNNLKRLFEFWRWNPKE